MTGLLYLLLPLAGLLAPVCVCAFQVPSSPPSPTKTAFGLGPSLQSSVGHDARRAFSTGQLSMATVSPGGEGNVGVVGRGFVSVLVAKLAALRGHNVWMLCPPGQEETITSLIDAEGNLPSNLELIASSDSEGVISRIPSMEALIVAVDDQTVMDEAVMDYVLNKELAGNVKRIVAMSRNLNGKDMGFIVKSAKAAANNEIWDNGAANDYKAFEAVVERKAKELGAEYTIARAGTLKGGGAGDVGEKDEKPQYMTNKFYEMTKKDILTWQLLFDCNVRGVKLTKGDVLPGPGGKAILTAKAVKASAGDTSRCGIADAMVRSLEFESAGNMDFGIGPEDSREPPSDAEWETLFSTL
uniref:NAD(P)-binding domain-containing protein n=1 Tax=Odontella aurita TaxID=265563 RepID=A0A7S4J6S8_9STRA|mmetsp:Transcript_4/g.8  ORF Transcript_4/g.8 Transcript_4/m.8 type:complete len:355 (+) Transcript_4:105-1169(+)|eukprot:CAMPEP_0113563770 /NCGR_PEP_ID=MMETSP0015_2-20120614/21249_1 /TAXON_ID=2838 /ORGANISM="Odontella" /LENGTH=354 /DNA_ID=CAMNT_0000465779 /DNA_START=89 /DNA_END=1153 /DNA_ORIENTATION=+ /assembly_acc=CAM_ASM_000160